MFFYDNLISEGKPIIFPYNSSDNGEVIFERWKTKIKFFHSSSAFDAKEKVEKVEKEVNDFLARGDRVLVNVKFNSIPENLSEKLIILLIYKEKEVQK